MAVCVSAAEYGDFAAPGGFGAPYPGAESPEMQMMNVAAVAQGPWNNQLAEPCYWAGEQGGDQSPGGGNGEWPGGVPPVPGYGSGWTVNGSPMMRPSGPPNGHGGNNIPANRIKRRFCTSFPDVQLCRRGTTCAFAHSREEIRAPLLSMEEERQEPSAMTDDFFMFKYKTLWCPIGVQHEWHTCVYAHNYQDARRPVAIGYGARLCPYWSKKDTGAEYSQRCPLGLRCPYAHGAKEQLYHPQYFKTVICRDLRGKACPRHGLCAFFHNRGEKRQVPAQDDIDYSQPLPEEALHADWIGEFLTPPFLPEIMKTNEDGVIVPADGMGNGGMTSYAGPQGAPYGMQQPFVFLMPYPGMQAMPGSPQQQPAQMGSPMGSPMGAGNNMGNWVFMPMDGSMPQ